MPEMQQNATPRVRRNELYTSVLHLKRVLAGRATAAFVPVSAHFIDPDCVPGMGALNEDADGRLQCPVRGCRKYFLHLSLHLNREHRNVGGAAGVREALGIPARVGLLSATARIACGGGDASHLRGRYPGRGAPKGRARPMSAMAKNMNDICAAQLQEKLSALAIQLGRRVTSRDFASHYGERALSAVKRTFGTWNNAKAIIGLQRRARGGDRPTVGRNLVLESMRTWYDAHGDLPSSHDVEKAERLPMLPCERTIKKALGVTTWHGAMRSVIEALGITSARYGEPGLRRGGVAA